MKNFIGLLIAGVLGASVLALGTAGTVKCSTTLEFELPGLDGRTVLLDAEDIQQSEENGFTVYKVPAQQVYGYYVNEVKSPQDLIRLPITVKESWKTTVSTEYRGPLLEIKDGGDGIMVPVSESCRVVRR